MKRHPPRSTRTDPHFPYPTLFRSLIAGIGLIIGAMSVTGVANSFSRELVQYAGGNLALLLAAGALTSFVLGMGMTASARSEEHTSELQSLMRISYPVFCWKKTMKKI